MVYNERLSNVRLSASRRNAQPLSVFHTADALNTEGCRMPVLHIALKDGFAGEPVTISVDGREIYRKDQVRTRTQIGFADSIETTHPPGVATVEVRARGRSAKKEFQLTQDLYIGVSIGQDGPIEYHPQLQPFGYM